MRALVTGGAGYLGSNLVDLLLEQGYEVAVLDNLSTGSVTNLAHCLERIRFINGSILDAELVEREVAQTDQVFHLAAAVGVKHIVDRPLEALLTNTRGTEIVLGACFKYWRRVLVASTSEVYGKTTKVPMSEDDDRVLGSTKVHRWNYSTAKALDEHLAFAYADLGLPVSVVRYFNSYGPRIHPGGYGSVVASFLGRAVAGEPLVVYGDGTQSRCFTYVDDTVSGTFLAGTRKEAIATVVNLGNPVETTINELAERVLTLVGSDAGIRYVGYEQFYGRSFADTKRRVPDVSRARELLGWQTSVDLEEGLSRTLEWWKQTH
ncbi:MAG: UDP-glucose 4-epimerase [Acidimicrobiia bacterium]|nr:UDP-glucose 4-epimerase [Acidimicrobiia bacterium]